MRLRKHVPLVLFILLCVVLIISSIILVNSSKVKNGSMKLKQKIVKVQRRNLEKNLLLRGVVTSEEKAIFAPVTAKIKNVLVSEGTYVKENSLIAILDDSDIRFELDMKKKEYENLKNELRNLQTKLKDGQIFSLCDGQVQEVYVNEKDYVTKGTPICKVVKNNIKFITIAFPKWLYNFIKINDKVNVYIPEQEQRIDGWVSAKSFSFYRDSNGFDAFDVEIVLNNSAISLGTQVYCTFNYDNKEIRSLNDGIVKAYEVILKSTVDGIIEDLNISKFSQVKRDALVAKISNYELIEKIKNINQQLNQLMNEISMKENKLKSYRIMSPYRGIITDISISNGKLVNEGEKIAVVWDPENLVFESKISELDVDKVIIGQKATIKCELMGKFRNKISEDGIVFWISKKPIEEGQDKNISFYLIKIKLTNSNLKRGMHASAYIKVVLKKDALCIPVEALREDSKGFYVWVKKLNVENKSLKQSEYKVADELGSKEFYYQNAEKRRIVVGESNEKYVEVLKGLNDNEEVILPQVYAK